MLLCINAVTSGVTEWDLDLLGVGEQGGVLYGLTADRLFEFSDDGSETEFSASVRTGDMDFGIFNNKAVPRAYLTTLQSGDLQLNAFSTLRGSITEIPYPLPLRASDGDEAESLHTIHLARGPRGVWWGFEVKNVGSCDFSMTGFQVLPVKLSLRG